MTRSTSPGTFLIRRVHVIRGDGNELHDADVAVVDGRIAQVHAGRVDVPGARIIDGSGKSLIPGLIDAHVHLDFLPVRNTLHGLLWSRFFLAKALRELLHNGVTSIRSMCDPLSLARRLRDRSNADPAAGPRMLIAGPALTARGGHPAATVGQHNKWLRTHMVEHPSDAEAARATVRRLHAAGVDLIKIVYQGGLYGEDRIALNKLPLSVAREVISEAHRLGLRVSAHTHYQDDVDALLEADVDSVEHGVIEHDLHETDTLRRWAAGGARLVPTLTITTMVNDQDGIPHSDRATRNLLRAYQAGVVIVAGTDSMIGAMPANSLHDELRLMVAAGMPERAVLQAATADAAELLALSDRGVIAQGKVADLVLLGSNPLERIENVGDIDLVFRGGRLVHEAPVQPPRSLTDYTTAGPAIQKFVDRTGATVPGEVTVVYDTTRFADEQIRTLHYLDPSTDERLRSETITSGLDLTTLEWTCEIPGDDTHLRASSRGSQISLTGTIHGTPISRSYPLRGRLWMQLLQFDPATFITAPEDTLAVVSLGTTGRGAGELTDFELTKRRTTARANGQIEIELVMPRWRRFWGAIGVYDSATGDLVRYQIRGKKSAVLQRAD